MGEAKVKDKSVSAIHPSTKVEGPLAPNVLDGVRVIQRNDIQYAWHTHEREGALAICHPVQILTPRGVDSAGCLMAMTGAIEPPKKPASGSVWPQQRRVEVTE